MVGSHLIAPEEAPVGDFEVVESQELWGEELDRHPTTVQGPEFLVGDGAAQVIEAARFRAVDLYPLGITRR